MSGAEDRARRTLTEAPADLLVDRLATDLERSYGITDVELLQVDYRLSALLPLTEGEPVTGPGHPAWRCFDHQEPILADRTGYFPVSMRGNGVGSCGSPRSPRTGPPGTSCSGSPPPSATNWWR